MTVDQLEKLKNALIYLSSKVYDPTKTKLLKLIYLCEELSIREKKFPFFGFDFYAWQFGPVEKQTWDSLNPDIDQINPSGMFSDILQLQRDGNKQIIKATVSFCDDQFSDNDLEIIDYVIEKYKSANASELVYVTHKADGLWAKTVNKQPGLMKMFDSKQQSQSNLILDFAEIFDNQEEAEIFREELAFFKFTNTLKKSA